MLKKNETNYIHVMEYISEKECGEINKLQELCHISDKTNLKLEIDYKLYLSGISKSQGEDAFPLFNKNNEFLYYVDDMLVAYLGISCFGGKVGEINGMTHPDYRKRGLFEQLVALALNECKHRNYEQVLLLTDANSASGIKFIQSIGCNYEHSEYRMKLGATAGIPTTSTSSVSLRIAEKEDAKEIARQNSIYFNDEEVSEADNENDGNDDSLSAANQPNTTTYMIELSGKAIGKINVEYGEDSAFLFGFGILPEQRKNGYGKAALKESLRFIKEKEISDVQLDVVCTNRNALNLYKACGFEEISVMNYYEYPIA